MARYRDYVFTVNNYTDEDEHQCWALPWEAKDCRYIVVGKECGESGTPHLQGYIAFKEKKSLKQLQEFFPSAHFEPRKGTPTQASDYCKKDGDFFEWGNIPHDSPAAGGAAAMEELMAAAVECIRQGDYKSVPMAATHFIKAAEYRVLKEQEQERDLSTMTHSDEDTPHLWIYGATGRGKSRYVDRLKQSGKSVYKKPRNKWWNGYVNQDIVHIEELGPKECQHLGAFMKEWCDRYEFNAETKGAMMRIRPKKIIVTSNYSIKECFPEEQDHLPLLRKMREINLNIVHVNDIDGSEFDMDIS